MISLVLYEPHLMGWTWSSMCYMQHSSMDGLDLSCAICTTLQGMNLIFLELYAPLEGMDLISVVLYAPLSKRWT